MKKIAILLVLIITLTAGLVGCGKETATDNNTSEANNSEAQEEAVDFSKLVQVRGSDTMVNLGQMWAEEFMNKHQRAQIAVTGGGSGTGIAAIINGTADIAQSSRRMREKEIEQARENGFELFEFVPGKDGIVVAVHKDNKIESLTMDQVKDIFTGVITNWKEVGGHDAEITLYSRESNSGTYAFFKEFVLKDEEYATSSLLMPSTRAIVQGLMQDSNGIGYIGLGYLTDEVRAVPISKSAGERGVLPSLDTILSGDYPIARGLYIYTAGEPEGVIKMFVDFLFSAEGQKIVKDLGFIPVR